MKINEVRVPETDNVPWQIRVVSPRAELTLELDGDGPGPMDARLMRGATVTAYVQGAVPPHRGGRWVVAIPAPKLGKKVKGNS